MRNASCALQIAMPDFSGHCRTFTFCRRNLLNIGFILINCCCWYIQDSDVPNLWIWHVINSDSRFPLQLIKQLLKNISRNQVYGTYSNMMVHKLLSWDYRDNAHQSYENLYPSILKLARASKTNIRYNICSKYKIWKYNSLCIPWNPLSNYQNIVFQTVLQRKGINYTLKERKDM